MVVGVAGFRAGHWEGDGTGVTVVLAPAGTVGSGEVRGGAPATREFELLDPVRTVARVDAVVLSGGSAFGLAAGDGVVRFLAERGVGHPTAGGPVPIVIGMSLFDLVTAGGRPGPDAGYAAAVAAETGAPLATGRVGAGSATRVGGWRGPALAVPGGLGMATATVPVAPGGPLATVSAVAAVNAVGDVVADDGTLLAGAGPGPDPFPVPTPVGPDPATTGPSAATTLVVVATDARLDAVGCRRWAVTAHDGLARALRPAHTAFDGDAVVCLASGAVGVPVPERVRVVVADVVAAAIRDAVAPR